MREYAIDGLFLTQKSTGTQRYACEILRELDKLLTDIDVVIVVPESFEGNIEYLNIRAIKYGKMKGIPWEQINFAAYLLKTRRRGIFLNNIVTLMVPHGIIAIHDVCYKAKPEFYETQRDKLSMIWHRLNYWVALHSKMNIITVSKFSKSEILKWYTTNEKKITVVYSAWQHMKCIEESIDVFEKYNLEKGRYYFSLSTLGANKNFRWILHAAKNNPDEIFAIAGGGKLKGAAEAAGFVNLPNVKFLGYILDSEIKSLMHYCKGFLFPTLYEGFGLTPLEAIACGASNIVVSDTPCMHEIYGDEVTYVDPNNIEKQMLQGRKVNSEKLLIKYSWQKSAKILKDLMIRQES